MVKVGRWSGANILVMPHLAIVLTEEREICRVEIELELTVIMEKKKVLKDVRWPKIKKCRGKDGKAKMIVFDLHDVVDYDADSHHTWIEESMKSLYLDRTLN